MKRVVHPDSALSPEELKVREKQREKRARRAQREAAAGRGEPLPPPICHRSCVADKDAAHGTLLKRKRKAEKEALLALMDGHIPYFAGAELLAAGSCSLAGPGPPRVAKEKAADLVGSAARAATEKAAAAMELAALGVTAAPAAIEGEEAAIDPTAREAAERAEAIGAAVEELVVQLERMEAERVRLETRLARELNADRGFVDASRSRSKARIDLTCFICMDIDSHADAYMPCCLHRVHRACIAKWHALGQNQTKHAIMAPRQDNGWKPVAMARVHGCPHCRSERLSARVPRV